MPVAQRVILRCHSCSHAVGVADVPMRLVALFRASVFPDIPRAVGEVRRRCESCKWVNVFQPNRHSFRNVEIKEVR